MLWYPECTQGWLVKTNPPAPKIVSHPYPGFTQSRGFFCLKVILLKLKRLEAADSLISYGDIVDENGLGGMLVVGIGCINTISTIY